MTKSKLAKIIMLAGALAATAIPIKYGIDFAVKEIDYFKNIVNLSNMKVSYENIQNGEYGLKPIKNPLYKNGEKEANKK